MRAALIASLDWLDEELAVFDHLVVGLMDEQIRVIQVVPENFPSHDTSAFGERVTWTESRNPFLQSWRLARLAPQLIEHNVDLIHCLDGHLWEASLRLAVRVGTPALLVASREGDVTRAHRVAPYLEQTRVAFAAATRPMLDGLKQALGENAAVHLVPTGVYVTEEARPPAPSDQPLCAVISGDGRLDRDYEALFQALRMVIDEQPLTQFFLYGLKAEQQKIWQFARKLGLLSNMSIIPRQLGHRKILLAADVLIHPQALGRSRSVMLEAMARGLPVLAKADRWLDYLIEGQTAWLVDKPEPEKWLTLIRRVIQDRRAVIALGEAARQWARSNHQASAQVEHTINLYRQLTSEPIKFPAGGP